MIWRICSRQRKERNILDIIDDFMFSKELVIDDNDTVFISREIQKRIIVENFYNFADLTTNIEDIKKLQNLTIIAVNQRDEKKEITIEIEGGV